MQGFFNGMQQMADPGPHVQGDYNWRIKKAQVKVLNDGPLIGKPGEIIFANVEVKNGMDFHWKQGASLQSQYSDKVAEVLDEVAIPIDFEVAPNQTFTLAIPMKVKDSAQLTGEEIHEATFGFCGKRGKPFGEPVVVKFKLFVFNEVEFYQKAMELFEAQKQSDLAFNEVVEALKEANGEKELAKGIMAKKQGQAQKKSVDSKVEENNMEF